MKTGIAVARTILFLSVSFLCACSLPVDANKIAVKRVSARGIDISFLSQNPWRKQKLNVNLDNVPTKEEMKIVEASLDDIIKFVAFISSDPPSGRATPLAVTVSGATNLRRPPVDPSSSTRQRFFHLREYDWAVLGTSEIALTVDFGTLARKTTYTDRFVFKKENGSWKFDRHEWPAPRLKKE